MANDALKDLLFGHVKDSIDANVLYTKWERSRVQARNRSHRSECVDYTPFEEIGNQNHIQSSARNRRTTARGDTT